MWPWQRNGEQPNFILLRRILAVISLGHGSVLLWMFVFYGDHTSLYSRQMIEVLLDADVTIVMVPLSKVVNKTMPVVAPAPTQPSQKKESKPDTTLAQSKSQPKTPAKKEEPTQPKKTESAPVKQQEPNKQIVKKESSEQAADKKQSAPANAQNVIHVGQHEYAALEVQKLIQQEAQRCWKSPIGVGSDVACQVVVCVDHNGSVKDITLTEKSGVVMYDVHARQAVSRMQFPRGAWGKEVIVYFKQS